MYDYLQKETTGGKEKRCATQVQIIRQAMNAMGCKIRWIDHPAMVVDGMTKRKAKLGPEAVEHRLGVAQGY